MKRNANAVSALLTNFDIAEKALLESQNAAGSAMAENEKYLDSINGKLEQLNATWEQFSANVLGSDIIKIGVDAIKELIDLFNKLDEATGGASSVILDLLSVVVVGGAVINSFSAKSKDKNSLFGLFLDAVANRGLIGQVKNLTGLLPKLQSGIVGVLTAVQSSIGATSLVQAGAAAIVAIGAAVALLYTSYQNYKKTAAPSFEDLQSKTESLQAEVDELSSSIKTANERIAELQKLADSGTISLTEEDELERLKTQNALLDTQLKLKQALLDANNAELAGAARSNVEDFFEGDDSSQGRVFHYGQWGKDEWDALSPIQQIKELKQNISDIDEEILAKQEELKTASVRDAEVINQAIIDLQSERNSKLSQIGTIMEPLNDWISLLDPANEDDAALIKKIKTLTYQIQYLTDDATALKSVFDDFWSDESTHEGITKYREDLEKAANAQRDYNEELKQYGSNVDLTNRPHVKVTRDKQPYYNITIEKVLQESRLETERAALTKLEGELSQYETLQSTYIEASAQGIDQGDNLSTIKTSIANKKAEISTKEALIEEITDEVDALLQQQIAINQECSFSAFFDETELLLLDKHIKENSISEESFVYQTVSSYTAEDIAQTTQTVSMALTGATVTRVQNTSGKEIYSVTGGLLNMTVDGGTISAKVIRAALECKTDGSYVMTAYLNNGSYQEVSYPSGCISLTGTGCTITSDVVADPEIEGSYKEGTSVNLTSAASNLYFTVNATEYAKRSVEWDLMEYGEAELEKLAWPAYTFSIDSSNFLALEDFLYFKNNFHLGNRVYLEMDNGEPLTPIVIGAEIEMDDPSSLKLIFSDTYYAKDNAFDIVSLLEESVSMGKKVSSGIGKFNAFVDCGASTSVKDFISNAIDYSKNKILSSSGQGIQIDESGITLRKLKAEGGYEPEQIKMINNSIVFTNDDWESAVMAIGKFHDENAGDVWGIVAQAIVGTLLAGSQLVIESAKKDGDIAVFRVDGDGARLYNSRFDLVNEYEAGSSGQISLIPHIGFVGGKTTSTTPLFAYDEQGNIAGIQTAGGNTITSAANIKSDDLPNANWFMDMDGNAYFKGTVYATDGRFSGTVYATDGEFTGTIHATDGDFSGAIKAATLEGDLVGAGGALKGISLDVGDGNFLVDSSGNVTMAGNINLSSGNITWGSNLPDTGVTESEVIDLIDEYGVSLPRYIKNTYISSTVVKSPTIKGNDKGVCLICGAVLVDRPFPQRTPDNVPLLTADRAPEAADLSTNVDQLITVGFQLTSAVRTVETVELLDRYIHNSHRHSLTLLSIQKKRLYEL